MNRDELYSLAEKHQAKADKAFMNYQETGIQRYERERIQNEDYADAFRMAAASEEEHSLLGNLKAEVGLLAARADEILAAADGPFAGEVLKEETAWQLGQLRNLADALIGAAAAYCHFKRREKI